MKNDKIRHGNGNNNDNNNKFAILYGGSGNCSSPTIEIVLLHYHVLLRVEVVRSQLLLAPGSTYLGKGSDQNASAGSNAKSGTKF